MAKLVRPERVGLVFAVLLGGWHCFWAMLVALRLAQPVIDFIFWLHFIRPVYVVGPFDPGIAALLIAVTSTIGFCLGWCLGLLWNWLARA